LTERIVSLLTGDSDMPTGGHIYNRHMSEEAARHGVSLEMIPLDRSLDLARVPGQILIDSLVAWSAAARLPGGDPRPMSALVHQVPGGVEGPTILRRARRLADLALYRKCDLIIAASTYLGDELKAAGLPKDRIRIVPPGRNIPDDESASPACDLRRGRRLVILNVANWVPNKGILDLLDAVEPISPDEVVLHLVGSPDLNRRHTRAIRARLRASTLRGKVVEHGSVPKSHLSHFYAGADVVALTSFEEGYGTVIGEALAAGVPVVAWNSGNAPNLFTDGEAGFLLPEGDVNGVTNALQRLARDEDLRSALSSGAWRRGADLPTWHQSGSLFFAALKEVDNRPHGLIAGRCSAL